MLSNWHYRLFALFLACACWYFIAGRAGVETWLDIPVVISNLPENMVLPEGLPPRVNVRIRGSQTVMRSIDTTALAYTLNLSTLTVGENRFSFESTGVGLPKALEAIEFAPARVTLVADMLARREVLVKPLVKAIPDKYFSLKNTILTPETVTVAGPRSIVSTLTEVTTLPVAIPVVQKEGTQTLEASVAVPQGVDVSPETIQIVLDFAVKTKRVWVKLPVGKVPGHSAGVRFSPREVQLQVDAPLALLEKKDFKAGFSLTVPAVDTLTNGKHILPYKTILPEGVILLKAVPETIEVYKKQ